MSRFSIQARQTHKTSKPIKQKKDATSCKATSYYVWALTDSNRRPSACKADALNQLS